MLRRPVGKNYEGVWATCWEERKSSAKLTMATTWTVEVQSGRQDDYRLQRGRNGRARAELSNREGESNLSASTPATCATPNEMQIAVKQKKLGEPIGETLLGKTVFIMGFGNIGIHLAKRLRPFGVKVLATKRSWVSHLQNSCNSGALPSQNGIYDDLVDEKGGHEDIHKFARTADIIVCCLAMNHETAGIVNKSFIASMKKGAHLVNIARGGLLDYEAVLYHLKSGHLGGLGIDVAWTEPFDPVDPVLKFPNVIITAHVAGVTECSYRSTAKVVGDVAIQLHAGTPLTGIEFVN